MYPPSSHQICGSVAHWAFKSAQTSLGCTIGTLLLKGSQVEKLISSTARNITPPPLQSSSQESPSFTPPTEMTHPHLASQTIFFSLIGGIILHRANSITLFNTRGTRSHFSGGIIAPLEIVIADKKGGIYEGCRVDSERLDEGLLLKQRRAVAICKQSGEYVHTDTSLHDYFTCETL